MRIIALITDFGTRDYYVGALKGVILSINPEVRIVDITHEIPPFQPISAAYILMGVKDYYPRGTIFLTVVDPKVGTSRKILLISADGKYYIGPDNGVFAPVYQYSESYSVYEINAEHLFLKEPSSTFEARDKMAPIAAWLSKGLPVERLGVKTEDYQKFRMPSPRTEGKKIKGIVLHIDRFGNLATNIRPEHVKGEISHAVIKGVRVSNIGRTFNDVKVGELLLLRNSLGFYEIGANMRSAAALLKATVTDPVEIHLK